MKYDLEIVIPVFHEERNIVETLENILEKIKLNFRILVIYDFLEDPTINEIKKNFNDNKIILVQNKYKGLNGAMKTAFEMSEAKASMLYTAEDHQNYDVINKLMVLQKGSVVVYGDKEDVLERLSGKSNKTTEQAKPQVAVAVS